MPELPDPSTYKYVYIHLKLRPNVRQIVPFYDKVYHSTMIEYRGRMYNALFLQRDHHSMNLKRKRKGWEDITQDWFLYLKEKEIEKETKEEEKPEEPVKRKRGRPRKKRV